MIGTYCIRQKSSNFFFLLERCNFPVGNVSLLSRIRETTFDVFKKWQDHNMEIYTADKMEIEKDTRMLLESLVENIFLKICDLSALFISQKFNV